MLLVPAMWLVWAALVLLFLALKIYASRLSRDEDDELILDDTFKRVQEEQAIITARLNKVQPLVRLTLVLVCVMTLVVMGYYVFDIIRQFQ